MNKLILLRGVSGSGKSHRAKEIVVEGRRIAIICSADNFFFVDGKYVFDPSKIGEAHQQCQNDVEEAMKKGDRDIIVDNTNMCYWEMLPYANLAMSNNYEIEFELVGSVERSDLVLYSERNLHGVSYQVICQQADNFDQWADIEEGFRIQRAVNLLHEVLRVGDRKLIGNAMNMLSTVMEPKEEYLQNHY